METDVVADNPGHALFHRHQQLHMDFGLMAPLAAYDSSYIFISQCFAEPELWSRCCAASH